MDANRWYLPSQEIPCILSGGFVFIPHMLKDPAQFRYRSRALTKGKRYRIPRNGYTLVIDCDKSRLGESLKISIHHGKGKYPSVGDLLFIKSTFYEIGDTILQLHPPKPGRGKLYLWRSRQSPPTVLWTKLEAPAALSTYAIRSMDYFIFNSHKPPPPPPLPQGLDITPKQLADQTGVNQYVIYDWLVKFKFPPVKSRRGQRIYFDYSAIAMVREFLIAGKPFHQIREGIWKPWAERPRAVSLDWLPRFLDHVDNKLLLALHHGQIDTVAEFLARLAYLRPLKRAAVLACVQAANGDGRFTSVIKQYSQADN